MQPFARIREAFRGLRLRQKILAYSAVIVLMITLACSFFATQMASRQIIARFGEQNAGSMEILADFLDELETRVAGKFQRLEQSEEARRLLSGETDALPAVEALLADMGEDRYVTEFILYDSEGKVAASWGVRRAMAIAGPLRDRIRANGRELYWYNSKYSNAYNVEKLSVYRTFHWQDESLGMMYIRLNTTEIADVYSMIGSNLGAGIYLLNGRGSLILPKNRGGELLTLCKERLAAYRGDSSEPVRVTSGSSEYLVYETYFQRYDLFAVCITLYADVVTEVTLFRRLVILLGLVCLVLVLLSSLWMANWISKPVMCLTRDIEKVRDGDLSVRIQYAAGDEISVLVQSFNEAMDRLVAAMEENERTQRQKRELEMTALQMQITPHFLYNSLESLSALALIGDDQTTYVMANALSMFYRGVLSDGRAIIRIGEEVDIARNYLEVQSIRYRDVFSYEIDVEEAMLGGGIVKLSLQPLVENAIYHGVRGIRWRGEIRILGRLEADRAIFEVADNGRGMTPQSRDRFTNEQHPGAQGREGFGMASVDGRLKLYYGPQFGLTILEASQGTRIRLTIPFAPYEGKA